jgi:hypothetical protein
MSGILILGPNRNYRQISTNQEAVSKGFLDLKGNLNPEKLITSLATSVIVEATACRPYGSSIPRKINGSTPNLQADVVDFFKQAQGYCDEHGADYVLIQNFDFEMSRTTKTISAVVQLLLEERV